MTSFVDLVAAAQTRWDAAVALLDQWNSRLAAIKPDRASDEFLELMDVVREHFDQRPSQLELTDADRSVILSRTAAGTDLHAVDAVGFGLNFAASAGFAHCWRERLGIDRLGSSPSVPPGTCRRCSTDWIAARRC